MASGSRPGLRLTGAVVSRSFFFSLFLRRLRFEILAARDNREDRPRERVFVFVFFVLFYAEAFHTGRRQCGRGKRGRWMGNKGWAIGDEGGGGQAGNVQ